MADASVLLFHELFKKGHEELIVEAISSLEAQGFDCVDVKTKLAASVTFIILYMLFERIINSFMPLWNEKFN